MRQSLNRTHDLFEPVLLCIPTVTFLLQLLKCEVRARVHFAVLNLIVTQ